MSVASYPGDKGGAASPAKAGPLFGQVLSFFLFSFQSLTEIIVVYAEICKLCKPILTSCSAILI